MLSLLRLVLALLVAWRSNTSNGEALDAVSYLYPDRSRYYFPSFQSKMNETLFGCSYVVLPPIDHQADPQLSIPHSNGNSVYVIPSPISPSIISWYLSIPKPKQMRVNPDLCEITKTYKKPIFNNTGCQLRHYMSLYAPRCQTKYLKSVCSQSQQEITDDRSTGFVLPESDHSLWSTKLPPQPFILAIRNAYATMCGQASLQCGYYHPSTNCHTTGYKSQAMRFHRKCTPMHATKVSKMKEFQPPFLFYTDVATYG